MTVYPYDNVDFECDKSLPDSRERAKIPVDTNLICISLTGVRCRLSAEFGEEIMNTGKSFASIIALAASLASGVVHAQDADQADGSVEERPVAVNEIVVTAQRREESLSKVPVSVSAFNSDVLEERNITSEQDLASLVPGLVVKSGQNSNQLSFTLRGQTLDPFSGSSPAVLTYVNEAPVTPGNTASAFFDFASLQVLKGPQGTLFGRNATGGAVLYETKKPGNSVGGFVTMRAGERDLVQLQGAIDLPVSDSVKFRFAGDYAEQDGYLRNANTGNTLGDTESLSGRITMVIEPSATFRNTTVAQYSDFGGTEGAGGLYSYHLCGETNAGYVLTATLACVYDTPIVPGIGDGPPGPGTWPGGVQGYLEYQQANPFDVWLTYDLPHKAHAAYVVNTTEIDLNDNMTVKNIFSWADSFARTPGILSGSPFNSLNLYNESGLGNGPPGGEEFDARSWSNELQLQGETADGTLEYIVGAFYSDTTKKEYIPVIVGPEQAIQDALGGPLADIAYNYRLTDESKAVFAQVNYHITDSLTATLGGRYTWEKLTLNQIEGSLFNLDGSTPLPQSASLSDPAWTFNLQYQASPSSMVYFSQRGSFRAGGFNGAVVPFNDANFFENETTYDFEFGYKFNGYLGNVPTRFNVALYRQYVENAQHSIFFLVAGNPAAFTVNVPEKRIQGIEMDANFVASNWLEFGFAGAYTDAKFTKPIVDLSAATGVDGFVIPFDTYTDAPKWAGSVYAEVGLPVPDSWGDMKLRADVFGQTSTYFSNNGGTITPRTQLPGFVTVDLRLGWNEIMGSGLSAAVFAKNLLNEFYYNSGYVEGGSGGFNTAIPGEPQTIGAELTYRF